MAHERVHAHLDDQGRDWEGKYIDGTYPQWHPKNVRSVTRRIKSLNVENRIITALGDYGDVSGVPYSDGSTKLKWHKDGYDIEIDISVTKVKQNENS